MVLLSFHVFWFHFLYQSRDSDDILEVVRFICWQYIYHANVQRIQNCMSIERVSFEKYNVVANWFSFFFIPLVTIKLRNEQMQCQVVCKCYGNICILPLFIGWVLEIRSHVTKERATAVNQNEHHLCWLCAAGERYQIVCRLIESPLLTLQMRPNVSLVSVIDEAKEMCIAYDKQRNATSQEIEARPSVGKDWEK